MAIDFAGLKRLAEASAAVKLACSCHEAGMLAWQAMPLTLELELDQFEEVASLVEDPYAEPMFAEYHPAGTRLTSDDAPIAPRYYPANLSHLLRCVKCQRHYLRYTEGGGYFTELRIRALQPQLLVDAPL
ncbi:hypothetical protein GTP46_20720 [Duganella sp. FT135W]|uniref:Uncharacterized protein n=1 Tax=Duganella flavida TaxID=2692175 RepID=A0A6L8KGU1_9BURK|nr:hypothetical protein [Duganella flavida]MYM25054.1 hypothetical protein [Duganella flavida]